MWPFNKRVQAPVDMTAEEQGYKHIMRTIETQMVDLESMLGLARQRMLSGQLSTGRFPASDTNVRQGVIDRCTKAFFWKPLGCQPITLTVQYALGQGGLANPKVVPRSEDLNEMNLKAQQEHLDMFWTDKWVQRAFSSYEAQVGNAAKLLYEGELWASIFGNTSEPPVKFTVRIMDSRDVLDPVVTLPSDDMIEVAYWVNQRRGNENLVDSRMSVGMGAAEEVLVRSTDFEDAIAEIDLDPVSKHFCEQIQKKTDRRHWLHHILIGADPIEHRGWPYTARAIDWIEHNQTIVENMIEHIRSLLAIAWHKKVQGSKQDLQQVSSRLSSVVRNLKLIPLVGSQYLSTDKITLEPIDTPTGGAQVSGEAAKLTAYQVGAATQWPYHTLMGDPSTGNLATAKSLELPTLKHCRWFQGIYRDFVEGVCDFVLAARFKEQSGRTQIEFPEITERDVQSEGTIVVQAVAAGILPIEDDATTGAAGAATYLRRLLEKHV